MLEKNNKDMTDQIQMLERKNFRMCDRMCYLENEVKTCKEQTQELFGMATDSDKRFEALEAASNTASASVSSGASGYEVIKNPTLLRVELPTGP